jgi:hypothetical protein
LLAGAVALAIVAGLVLASRGHPAGIPRPTVSPNQVGLPSVASLKAINYDRADAGWTYLWQRWDPTAMDRDFARIASMSANAVRISIQPSAFGWPRPARAMEKELTRTVALASDHGLRVEVVLFDWWGSYTDQASSDRWARAVLAPLKDSANVAFIELQNEIRPEDPQAMAWARHELPVVKHVAGNIPVTVSVTNNGSFTAIEQLAALKSALSADPPDFFDLHVYGPAGEAYSEMAAAKALVAPAQLYIGEVGSSSLVASSAPSPGLAEAQQDQDLRTVEWAAQANGLPAPAVWTYEDFDRAGVPPAASLADAGYQYGLFRADGSPKPSAVSLAGAFADATIDTGFNGGFEASAGGVPTLWREYRPDQGHLAWDPTVSHTGQASVRLSQTTGDATGAPSFFAMPVITPLRVGEQFHVQGWAKGEGVTGINVVSVSWFGAGYVYLGQDASTPLRYGTTPWTELTALVTVPAGALYARIYVKSFNNRGTVWFDDVTFTPDVKSQLPATGSNANRPAPALLRA